MDQPVDDAIDSTSALDVFVPPVRNTRSAQRRRAVPEITPAIPDELSIIQEKQAVPEPVEPVALLTEPVPFIPPAAVMADTIIEDHVMDTINTAETADAVKDTAGQMADRGKELLADMNGRAKDAMEKSGRMAEDLGAFGKGNMEALVESSKIVAKAMETMSQEAAEFSRKSFESATAAMKTLAATRSPTEFMKLQSDYARSMFDTMIAETSKSTEMMMKLANEVAQPISSRVAIAAEKMKVTG